MHDNESSHPGSVAPNDGALGLECIDSAGGLDALKRDWDAVQDTCPQKHVLLDHRWVAAWWRHFGAGKQLHVLKLTRAGRAVGIAPFVLSRGREAFPAKDTVLQIAEDHPHVAGLSWRRVVPIRRVGFPLNIPALNFRGHLLLADDDPGLYDLVMNYWAERPRDWDMLTLEGLPLDSIQPQCLHDAARKAGLRPLRHGATRHIHTADLPDSFEAYLQTRSGHFRRRLRAEMRKNASAGKIELQSYRGNEIGRGLEILYDLERRSWKAKGDLNRVFQLSFDDKYRAFYTDVATALAATDEAEVLVMRLDGEPAAALLSYSRQDMALTMLIFHDEQTRGKVSSVNLYQRFVEGAIERGMRKVDLHGVTVNVGKWATGSASYRRLYLFNRRPYSRLLRTVKSAATRTSRLRRRIKKDLRDDQSWEL